jgi:hypothetical protein
MGEVPRGKRGLSAVYRVARFEGNVLERIEGKWDFVVRVEPLRR